MHRFTIGYNYCLANNALMLINLLFYFGKGEGCSPVHNVFVRTQKQTNHFILNNTVLVIIPVRIFLNFFQVSTA